MIKMPLSVIRVAAFCLLLALLASCGEENGAPTGSTITVTPELKEWVIGAVTCNNSDMQNTWFNIVVKNPNGIPMTGVDIRVSLDLAPGTFSSLPPYTPMFLYDDLDKDGNYDNRITAYPYFTNTGSSGTKMLRVEYDLTCTYAGDLEVTSGSSFGSAHISVEFEAP